MKILLDPCIDRNPKVLRLACRLGMTPPPVVGYLAVMWGWVLTHRVDGRLWRLTDKEVAAAAGWRGNPSRFIEAMVDVGFLDRTHEGLEVHDWEEHQGPVIQERAAARDRKRAQRARQKAENIKRHVTRDNHAPIPSHPIPSIPSPSEVFASRDGRDGSETTTDDETQFQPGNLSAALRAKRDQ